MNRPGLGRVRANQGQFGTPAGEDRRSVSPTPRPAHGSCPGNSAAHAPARAAAQGCGCVAPRAPGHGCGWPSGRRAPGRFTRRDLRRSRAARQGRHRRLCGRSRRPPGPARLECDRVRQEIADHLVDSAGALELHGYGSEAAAADAMSRLARRATRPLSSSRLSRRRPGCAAPSAAEFSSSWPSSCCGCSYRSRCWSWRPASLTRSSRQAVWRVSTLPSSSPPNGPQSGGGNGVSWGVRRGAPKHGPAGPDQPPWGRHATKALGGRRGRGCARRGSAPARLPGRLTVATLLLAPLPSWPARFGPSTPTSTGTRREARRRRSSCWPSPRGCRSARMFAYDPNATPGTPLAQGGSVPMTVFETDTGAYEYGLPQSTGNGVFTVELWPAATEGPFNRGRSVRDRGHDQRQEPASPVGRHRRPGAPVGRPHETASFPGSGGSWRWRRDRTDSGGSGRGHQTGASQD